MSASVSSRLLQSSGRQRIIEGAVGRPVTDPEVVGQGAQLAVRHFVAHQPAGQQAGVDDPMGEPTVLAATHGCVQEAEIEAHVVAHDHVCVGTDELEQ